MHIWQDWTALLAQALDLVGTQFGVTQAVAVILLTLLVRIALMPISLTAAVRMEANKQKMKLLKPELDALKLRLKDDPSNLASETLQLYRQHKIRLLDRLTIANIGTQSVFGMGLFHALGKVGFTSKFLWISNLGKPDFLLTVLIGIVMLVGAALAPGAFNEPSMLMVMCVTMVLVAASFLTLPSAVGVYWVTSNSATIVQTLVLRALLKRRAVAGL